MLHIGDRVADFALESIHQRKKLNFSSLIKSTSPIALFFYKYDCPTCQFTFKHLSRIDKETGSKHFLAIAQDELSDIEKFRVQYALEFDILSDPYPYAVSVGMFGIKYVPTAYVIESDGRISSSAEAFDKIFIENFSLRIARLNNIPNFSAFNATEQVPLLKPG